MEQHWLCGGRFVGDTNEIDDGEKMERNGATKISISRHEYRISDQNRYRTELLGKRRDVSAKKYLVGTSSIKINQSTHLNIPPELIRSSYIYKYSQRWALGQRSKKLPY